MADPVLERVQEVISAAVADVCGLEYSRRIMRFKRARVRRWGKKGTPDFISYAPNFIFNDLANKPGDQHQSHLRRRKQNHQALNPEAPATMPHRQRQCATATSDYGLERKFSSARRLAKALIEAVSDDPLVYLVDLVAKNVEGAQDPEDSEEKKAYAGKDETKGNKSDDDDDARIFILTKALVEEESLKGRLLCRSCSKFFNGEKGLRWHQQIAHKRHYGEAKEVADSQSWQLVLYRPVIADASSSSSSSNPSSTMSTLASTSTIAKRKMAAGLEAARDGDLSRIKSLVEEGGWDPKTSFDRHGSSALLWAAGGGHLQVCQYLVDRCNVPVDLAQKRDGRNAMHWACRNGRIGVCRWLHKRGVSVNLPTKDGTAPLHWAVWKRHVEVCRWLVEEAKADLHVKNSFGCNAMQWAAMSGDLKVAKWLVGKGLNPGILNTNGHSALHKAAVKGQEEICRWLLSHEVGLGLLHLMADKEGNTPARMAELEGHKKLARYLSSETERRSISVNNSHPQLQK